MKYPKTVYPTEFFYHSYHKGNPDPSNPLREHTLSNGDPCAICGRDDQTEGYRTYTKGRTFGLISDAFGETYTLKAPWSAFSCKYCESAIRDHIRKWAGALITETHTKPLMGIDKARIHQNSITIPDLRKVLIDPPREPFVLTLNRSLTGKNGSHFINHGIINLNRDRFFINELTKVSLVNRDFVIELDNRTNTALAAGVEPSIPLVDYYLRRKLKGFPLNPDNKADVLTLQRVGPYLEGDFVDQFLSDDNLYIANLYSRSLNFEEKMKKAGGN